MIKSMTGFGRCETLTPDYKISVEIKAVNHRFLDLGIKMPKRLNVFEPQIRSLLKNYIQRGKVDVYISCENYTENTLELRYNRRLAGEYMRCFQQMQAQFGLEDDIRVSVLASMPEVLTMEQTEKGEDEIWRQLRETVEKAAEHFTESRLLEGEKLKEDLLEKLKELELWLRFIEERFPQVLKNYRTRLEDKVKELLAEVSIDENRIAAEAAIYADRICVDEELVRLHSHIEAARKELRTGGGVGRKLDFLAQEMNREANTALSKSTDLEISNKAIELKTGIEKIREQIQNIE